MLTTGSLLRCAPHQELVCLKDALTSIREVDDGRNNFEQRKGTLTIAILIQSCKMPNGLYHLASIPKSTAIFQYPQLS
ncbi:hypothetical protein CEXT_489731 [Caerostris extrusa]|uniref:Uncharacterized protein n=1 Tax=Caerostris extrusa TaxID=172846 RepID=A0AAV4M994_CAEEX|nr:hypothetical protein CEXT_489731 [Caerostris extrusa]